MKVRIEYDERYPDYSFEVVKPTTTTYGSFADVPKKKVAEWRRAEKAYDKAQHEMSQMAYNQ